VCCTYTEAKKKTNKKQVFFSFAHSKTKKKGYCCIKESTQKNEENKNQKQII